MKLFAKVVAREPRVVERGSFEAFLEHGEHMDLPDPAFLAGIMNAIDDAKGREA